MTTLTLTILVDNNEPVDPECKCAPAPGLSMLLERRDFSILFDTGPDKMTIISNADRLEVDRSKLESLIISHRHRDHTGGIESVFELRPDIPVYLPEDIDVPFPNKEVISGHVILKRMSTGTIRIIHTIGEYKGSPIPENHIVLVDKDDDAYIFCGCCHTGIDKVVEVVADMGLNPLLVAGGLHLVGKPREEIERIADKLVKYGVEIAIPIHCSGHTIKDVLSEKGVTVIEAGVCSQIPLEYR